MIRKRLLVPERRRTPPREGFSWIDRRFLRDHASGLSRHALLLYFFLAAVSDKDGLSFYKDATLAVRLRLEEPEILRARNELIDHDLIAFRSPLTQVLALPQERLQRGGIQPLSEILHELAQPHPKEPRP
jgi:hypothetical protein